MLIFNMLTEDPSCNEDEETKRTRDAKAGSQFSISTAEDHDHS